MPHSLYREREGEDKNALKSVLFVSHLTCPALV